MASWCSLPPNGTGKSVSPPYHTVCRTGPLNLSRRHKVLTKQFVSPNTLILLVGEARSVTWTTWSAGHPALRTRLSPNSPPDLEGSARFVTRKQAATPPRLEAFPRPRPAHAEKAQYFELVSFLFTPYDLKKYIDYIAMATDREFTRRPTPQRHHHHHGC